MLPIFQVNITGLADKKHLVIPALYEHTLINMKAAMTLHAQSLPGLIYVCPDCQNQQVLKVTGYDEDIVFHSCTSPPVFSYLRNYLFHTWSNCFRGVYPQIQKHALQM